VGIDAKLNTLEYGAYIARVLSGKHDSMVFGPYTPFLEPDGFLFFRYSPGESRNTSMVNDQVVADMLVRQRRTLEPARRRQIIFDIERYLATQQYYIQMVSEVYIAVWDRGLRNYGPNLGYDWGGRLTAASSVGASAPGEPPRPPTITAIGTGSTSKTSRASSRFSWC